MEAGSEEKLKLIYFYSFPISIVFSGKQKTPASLTGVSKALEIAFIDKRDAEDISSTFQSLQEQTSGDFDKSFLFQGRSLHR